MRVRSLLLALSLAGCGAAQTSAVPPSSSVPGAPPTTLPSPPPPAVLSPGASPEAERRLSATAQSRIDGAEQLVRGIEMKQMAMEQRESLSTIQSFLGKAREAMSQKDFQRAFTLADKAHQLAEDLARRVR